MNKLIELFRKKARRRVWAKHRKNVTIERQIILNNKSDIEFSAMWACFGLTIPAGPIRQLRRLRKFVGCGWFDKNIHISDSNYELMFKGDLNKSLDDHYKKQKEKTKSNQSSCPHLEEFQSVSRTHQQRLPLSSKEKPVILEQWMRCRMCGYEWRTI